MFGGFRAKCTAVGSGYGTSKARCLDLRYKRVKFTFVITRRRHCTPSMGKKSGEQSAGVHQVHLSIGTPIKGQVPVLVFWEEGGFFGGTYRR